MLNNKNDYAIYWLSLFISFSAICLCAVALCLCLSFYHILNEANCGNSVVDPLVFALNKVCPIGLFFCLVSVFYTRKKKMYFMIACVVALLFIALSSITMGLGVWFFHTHLETLSFVRLVWWIPAL